MGKKSENENKVKIKSKFNEITSKGKSVDSSPQKEKSKKSESAKKEKKKKKKEEEDELDEEEKVEEEYEEMILPGQKYPTPPAGDATRAFYESLLEQKSNSLMAIKYCVEYGCLEPDKAKQLLEVLDKEKNKKKKK